MRTERMEQREEWTLPQIPELRGIISRERSNKSDQMSAKKAVSKNKQTRSSRSDSVHCSPSSLTPETDAAEFPVMTWPSRDNPLVVRSTLARKLETERDELRAKYAMHHAEAEKLTKVIRAATVLIAAKGRHNTMLAYEGLRAAISPENVHVEASPLEPK